jgi:hypothetical protein
MLNAILVRTRTHASNNTGMVRLDWLTCDAGSCGPPLTEGGDLIGCAAYGLSTRASDPTIGKNLNDLIRSGSIISVDNPVGLYLEKLDTTGKLQ